MKKNSIDTKQVTEAAVSHFHSFYRIGKIAHFLIDAPLSQGSIHDCYRVFDPKRSKTLFLKILNQKQGALPSSLASLEKEAKILSSLSHPYLARYIDHGTYDGKFGLVTQYYDSITLRHFLQEENPSIDEAFSILEQLAQVLSYLHENEIIHSDLKPENILVLPSAEIRLVDFGIAQFINSQVVKKVQRLAGTLLYMSPEQHEQEGKLSYSSDLYSLAIIAFELVTGRLSHGVVKLTALPAPLQKTFAKALNPDPAKRFASALSFLDALKAHRKAFSTKISAQIRPMSLAKGLLAEPLFSQNDKTKEEQPGSLSFTIPPHFWPISALWLTHQSEKTGKSYGFLVESSTTCSDSYIALHREFSFFQNLLNQLGNVAISCEQALSQLQIKCRLLAAGKNDHLFDPNTLSDRKNKPIEFYGSSFLIEIDPKWEAACFYPITGKTQCFARETGREAILDQMLSQETLPSGQSGFSFSLDKIEALWWLTSHMSQKKVDKEWIRSCLNEESCGHNTDFSLRLAREASERASREISSFAGASMQRTPKKVGVCALHRSSK